MNRLLYFGVLTIALAGFGIAMWLFPDLTLQFDTAFIAVIGVIILAIGYHRYIRARGSERDQTDVANVEERPPVRTPGDILDESWDEYRFEEVATAVIAAKEGCTHEEAFERLSSGDWTDDRLASSYFGATGPTPPIRRGFFGLIPMEYTLQELRSHAIDELVEIMGLETTDES